MEDRTMDKAMTTTSSALDTFAPGKASLLEMRADSARFPRVKAVPRVQAIVEISKIVSQAFLYRGQAADVNNIQFISTSLVDELLADDRYNASSISFAEIQVVVKRAILGGSDIFGISVSSLYKVIMDYVTGEGHNNQKIIDEMRRRDIDQSLRSSALGARIQSFSEEFAKNHTINR